MKIYEIYIKSNCSEALNELDFIALRSGFSLYAAFFHFFWLLYQKMWSILAAALLVNVAITILTNYPIFGPLVTCLQIAIPLILGVFASDLKGYDLKRKGYIMEDIVLANCEEEAEIAFLTKKFNKL